MNISFKKVVLVILLLLLLAHVRQIGDLVHAMRFGEMLQEASDHLWAMPWEGRYILVMGVLALVYYTVFMLINNRK
jgi:hypothetical protein